MKTNKKMIIIMLVAIAVSASALISGCITLPQDSVLQGFEVHEWGVFQQQYNSNIVNVVNFPSPEASLAIARKPVIYFHYDKNISDLVVEVNFNGDILVTIPDAVNTSSGIGWTVDIVNNSVIASNGTAYEYLFYECQINVSQGVIAYILDDGANVTFYVKNIADYTISNLFFIYGGYIQDLTYNHYGLTYITIEKLDSGEETLVTVPLKNTTEYSNNGIKDILIERGLTEKEASELVDYWMQMWFYPTNVRSYAQMIYTIPQEVYDQLLPISIKPIPEIMKRVGLFFITDIPINPPTEEKVGSGLPGFKYDPELILPEVYVGNQSIWTSTLNTSKWYTLPFPYIFIEKYSNHSKEVIEIMKMQVAMLGEDPELFEKCIQSVQGTFQSSDPSVVPDDLVSLLCLAWKGTLTGLEYGEDDGKEVWALTYITRANGLVGMQTYYVDINTLQVLPWTICTD